MTRISAPKRGRRGAKKIDLTPIREALRDSRQWTALGVVIKPEGAASHFELVDNADVLVEVELQPGREVVTARLAAGMWIVPALGEEVAVLIPAGELDFQPTITCILSNTLPTAQGPAPNRIVIVRGEVLVHDGAGGAKELAYKSDVEAVDAKYADHIHLDSAGGGTSGPLATVAPNPPNPAFPGSDPVNPFLDPPYTPGTPTTHPFHEGNPLEDAGIEGTSVLKAK